MKKKQEATIELLLHINWFFTNANDNFANSLELRVVICSFLAHQLVLNSNSSMPPCTLNVNTCQILHFCHQACVHFAPAC